MRRIEAWGVFLLFLLLLPVFAWGEVNTVNEIVAVVNGEPITRFELQNQVQSSLTSSAGMPERQQEASDSERTREVLRSMITEVLLRQKAESLGITVSEDDVKSRVKRIRQQNDLSRQELKEQLRKRGTSLEEFRQKIREKIKVNRLISIRVRKKVVVTEKELRRYYREHKEEYLQPREVHLSLILIRDRERLKELRGRISSGETSFSRAAREYSLGPRAESGGDLGFVQWKDLSQTMRDVLQDLDPGQISPVFPLKGGYALVRLEEMKSGGGEFSSVKDQVREKVYTRKVRQRYREYMEKLRSEAVIEVRL
ncbi:MAG: SurA N-terminal domain-containing protein [Desulfohalobiaceae bacterium]|nr:SurA N-terminal domain-containing protein [Desulfohalobiaceae bacterium]